MLTVGQHPPEGVRERALAAARAAFVEVGFGATSMQSIADSLGVTKPALYYHFDSKEQLLAALVEPVLGEFEALLEPKQPPLGVQAVIDGYIDIALRHRDLLVVLARDLSFLGARSSLAERFRDVIRAANARLVRPGDGLDRRVRAAQTIAGIGDAVALFAGEDPEELRRVLSASSRRLLSP